MPRVRRKVPTARERISLEDEMSLTIGPHPRDPAGAERLRDLWTRYGYSLPDPTAYSYAWQTWGPPPPQEG